MGGLPPFRIFSGPPKAVEDTADDDDIGPLNTNFLWLGADGAGCWAWGFDWEC